MHGQLAAAELAEGEDGPARVRVRCVRGGREAPGHRPRGGLDGAVGDERQLVVQQAQATAGQPLGEHLELFYGLDAAEGIEARRQVVAVRDHLVEGRNHRGAKGVPIEIHGGQEIEQLGVGGESRGEQVAGVEADQQPAPQLVILEQRAIQRGGRPGTGHDRLEADQDLAPRTQRRLVRKDRRQQIRQEVARGRPALRRGRVERPDRLQRPVRVLDAGRGEARPSLFVVDLAGQQPEQLAPRQPLLARLVVEEVGIDGVDAIPVAVEHGGERPDLVETEPPRQRPQAPRAGREAVRLLALGRLQPVLDVPQEYVGGREVRPHLRFDEVVGAELVQGGQGVAGPQRRLIAAVDQLEHLREQLHLADAAAALLDVEVEVAVTRMFPVGARLVARELLDGGGDRGTCGRRTA